MDACMPGTVHGPGPGKGALVPLQTVSVKQGFQAPLEDGEGLVHVGRMRCCAWTGAG